MRILFFGLTVAAIALTGPAAAKVKILGNTYSDREVCGGAMKNCGLSNGGNPVTIVSGSPKIIPLRVGGIPDYDYVLGKVYQRSMSLAGNYCGNVIENDLATYAQASNLEFYKVLRDDPISLMTKVRKVRNLNANIDFVALASLAGVPANKMSGVEAAMKAAYAKSRSRTIDLKGRFIFVEINQTLLARLSAATVPTSLQPCAAWLNANPKNGIYDSLTGFVLTQASASSALTEGLSVELKAKLSSVLTDTEIVALTASMVNEIEKRVEQTFHPNVTILTLGRTTA
ncbi:hypothetical protein [Sphingomonas sp. PB4P5]|uniref:hypothetical protein n=1 Tax=Parasphingomonas puruogangriensis TaxID=3096155 RepID=UPI002FCAF290